MKSSRESRLLILAVASIVCAASTWAQELDPVGVEVLATATGNSFTYQGRLMDAGSPADGTYDFRFRLFDALGDGTQVGSDVLKGDQVVSDGLFAVELDFGALFTGTALWLEVGVRPGASTGSYQVLAPRHPVTNAPYAGYALKAPWSGLTGVPVGFADGIDDDTTYTAGTGITLAGGAFSITASYRLPPACASGQLAQWDGSAWQCSDYAHGHWGQTWSGSGTGLTLTGGTEGLYADGNSTAIYGLGHYSTGTTVGVRGVTYSVFGSGVEGDDNSSTYQAYGVYGKSLYGTGVFGEATGGYTLNYGVHGKARGPGGYGVYGHANDTGSTNYGVYGVSDSTAGYGVYASSPGYVAIAAAGDDNSWTDQAGDILLRGNRGEILAEATMGLLSNQSVYIDLDEDNNNTNSCFQIYNGANTVISQTCEDGTKSAVLQTASFGQRAVYVVESPEVWLEEFGSAGFVDGVAVVPFEATFAETINAGRDYHVFIEPVCDEPVLTFVTAKTKSGFTAKGVTLEGDPAACRFDYHVVAKRAGLEDVRLEPAASSRDES